MTETTKKKVWINGLSGRMGEALQEIFKERSDIRFLGGASQQDFSQKVSLISQADLVIDFSSPEGTKALAEWVKTQALSHTSFLICTTGLSDDVKALWSDIARKSSLSIMLAPNTSLGVLLTLKASLGIASVAHKEGFDILLDETHHREKKDSPSGTALFLASALSKETGLNLAFGGDKFDPQTRIMVQASRGGGVFGEHTIRFISNEEEVSITHRAFSRALFAKGAVYLGLALSLRGPGFYNLESFLSR